MNVINAQEAANLTKQAEKHFHDESVKFFHKHIKHPLVYRIFSGIFKESRLGNSKFDLNDISDESWEDLCGIREFAKHLSNIGYTVRFHLPDSRLPDPSFAIHIEW